jgi:FKBP-type peptidyl-prolyl cis-trans isomerase
MSFFNEGIEDAIKVEDELNIDGYLRLTLDEILQLFTAYREKEMAKAEEEKIRVYNENLEANAKWLAEVEQMEGVKKTESGLLYRIDRVGNGAQPTQDSDVVLVHYVGKLRTGEIFDSSYQRCESISFALNQVIKGWTEGMKYVRAGGQITLWIPAELAYGERGAGEDIGPGEALEFKVELLDVNPRR